MDNRRPIEHVPVPGDLHVRLGHLGRVRCEPGWRLGHDWASRLHDFDLWFVWGGRGTMRLTQGRTIRLMPGVGIWMRPGGHYEATQDSSDRLGVSYVHFTVETPGEETSDQGQETSNAARISHAEGGVARNDGRAAGLHGRAVTSRPTSPAPRPSPVAPHSSPLAPRPPSPHPLLSHPASFIPPFEVFHTRQVEFVDAVMRRVTELATDRRGSEAELAAARSSAERLFAALLSELVREHQRQEHRPPGPRFHREAAVARLIAQLREDPAHAPSIAQMARSTGITPDHFTRVFRRIAGQTPEGFVIAARMERARLLLEESDLTIGEIAESLGFQDIYFFSRQFKRKTGVPPSAWRRQSHLKSRH